jgi:hypothetical protein
MHLGVGTRHNRLASRFAITGTAIGIGEPSERIPGSPHLSVGQIVARPGRPPCKYGLSAAMMAQRFWGHRAATGGRFRVEEPATP